MLCIRVSSCVYVLPSRCMGGRPWGSRWSGRGMMLFSISGSTTFKSLNTKPCTHKWNEHFGNAKNENEMQVFIAWVRSTGASVMIRYWWPPRRGWVRRRRMCPLLLWPVSTYTMVTGSRPSGMGTSVQAGLVRINWLVYFKFPPFKFCSISNLGSVHRST